MGTVRKLLFRAVVSVAAALAAVVMGLAVVCGISLGTASAAAVEDAVTTSVDDFPVMSDVATEAAIAYEPPVDEDGQPEDDGYPTGDDVTLGEEVAWLAVQMAATASPESRPTNPSHNVWEAIADPRIANEVAVMDAEEAICPEFNCAYASCTQASCAVLAAVVDMDMLPHSAASGGPTTILDWMRNHPGNWERIWSHDEADLLPGDVFCSPGHTAIYVGHDLPQTRFPGTGASVYEASYSIAAYAGLDNLWLAGDVEVYRPIQRNYESRFPGIDYRSIVSGG